MSWVIWDKLYSVIRQVKIMADARQTLNQHVGWHTSWHVHHQMTITSANCQSICKHAPFLCWLQVQRMSAESVNQHSAELCPKYTRSNFTCPEQFHGCLSLLLYAKRTWLGCPWGKSTRKVTKLAGLISSPASAYFAFNNLMTKFYLFYLPSLYPYLSFQVFPLWFFLQPSHHTFFLFCHMAQFLQAPLILSLL